MDTKNNGGPAFPPHKFGDAWDCGYFGMTLRDWFAGQALVGLMASADVGNGPDDLAAACGAIADAMIAERNKP